MILPNNGKVAIIDDKYEEVKHLMQALAKERMPYLFFTDQGGDDLPSVDNPIESIRLVFLDLDLGVAGLGEIEMIRVVQARMERILQKNSPYVLVYWSSHEDKLSKALNEEFEGDFNAYKPIAQCSLDKSVISRVSNNIVETIRENLKICLQPQEAFNAFLFWESIVNKSSGELVNVFTKIFDFNSNWDKNIKGFFYRLAKANVGEVKINNITNTAKLHLALETINSALVDIVEKNIRGGSEVLGLKISDQGSNITQSNLVSINTKLHLMFSEHLEHFIPGNIYFPGIQDEKMMTEIVKNTFDKNNSDKIISSDPIAIKIDVTPVCDYSQDKGYTRLLPGILVDEKYKPNKKSSTPIFIYDLCPIVEIEGKNYYPVFDFRFFKALKQESVMELFPQKPRYKIRPQLLADLQAGLSNHINRPGIVNVI